jgi:hypothetical protein
VRLWKLRTCLSCPIWNMCHWFRLFIALTPVGENINPAAHYKEKISTQKFTPFILCLSTFIRTSFTRIINIFWVGDHVLPMSTTCKVLGCVWNVVAHSQKPDFVFRRNGRVHLNRRGASVQSTSGSRVVRISGSNAGYTMFRGSVKVTGYPLHSPVSPSLPHPCVTVCHHISSGLYCVV